MMKSIRISAGEVAVEAALYDNPTSTAIWAALPIEGGVNRWGDEIYYDIPVEKRECSVTPRTDKKSSSKRRNYE